MKKETIIDITLVIKGDSQLKRAEDKLIGILNNWISEEITPPFSEGSLLLYTFKEVD